MQPLVHLLFLLLDELGTFSGRDGDDNLRRGGYRCVGLPDMDAGYVEVIVIIDGGHDGPYGNHGTAASFIDVHARMSSQSALKADAVPAALAARSLHTGYGDAMQL